MNGGHMGNFSQGRYGGLQQDFHSLNTLFGNNLKQVIFVGLIVLVIYVFFKRQKTKGRNKLERPLQLLRLKKQLNCVMLVVKLAMKNFSPY